MHLAIQTIARYVHYIQTSHPLLSYFSFPFLIVPWPYYKWTVYESLSLIMMIVTATWLYAY